MPNSPFMKTTRPKAIAVAKIDTEGNRVADVFYVTEVDGKKLETKHRTAEVREGLLTALKALP